MEPQVSSASALEAQKILQVIAKMQAVAGGQEPAAKPPAAAPPRMERVLYGLPCAHCRSYYAAELDTCPICKHRERVSPKTALKIGYTHSL
ncbi:MAG TPA: hypothetical protein VGF06_01550 [Terriglobales bacterium]|jgi:hypothetical protein